jgi:hypothetical protein
MTRNRNRSQAVSGDILCPRCNRPIDRRTWRRHNKRCSERDTKRKAEPMAGDVPYETSEGG